METVCIPGTLIIVCAHAVYAGTDVPSASTDDVSPPGEDVPSVSSEGMSLPGEDEEREWFVESFQRGESRCFMKHIAVGVWEHFEAGRMRVGKSEGGSERGAGAEGSLLVFSGGGVKGGLWHGGQRVEELVGRRGDGGRTEGGGYLALAKARRWFGLDRDGLMERTTLVEEYSTDSFQNVLFSLILYHQYVAEILSRDPAGRSGLGEQYPKRLVVVSHEFKRRRFMELHIPALRFPRDKVEFIGIDPPWEGMRREEMVRGEKERGYLAWKADPYGVGELLASKRRERGWDADMYINVNLSDERWTGLNGTERMREAFAQLVKGRALCEGRLGVDALTFLPWKDATPTDQQDQQEMV